MLFRSLDLLFPSHNTGAVNVADKYEDADGEIQNVYLVREDIEELIAFYNKNKAQIASREDF